MDFGFAASWIIIPIQIFFLDLLLGADNAVVIALAGTGGLWLHYGTAVFFETIRAGFIGCFG